MRIRHIYFLSVLKYFMEYRFGTKKSKKAKKSQKKKNKAQKSKIKHKKAKFSY